MGNNVGVSKLLEAYHRMSPLAAQWVLEAAQMYAEQYPRPIDVPERFQMEEGGREGQNFDGIQMVGDVSPCGMSVIEWPSRRISWSNNAYKQHFIDFGLHEASVGLRVDELLPMFTESGLEMIFAQVAETGNPFHATAFPLQMPGGQVTHWDWSLTVLPTAAGDSMSLLVQMHRVHGLMLSVVA